VAEPTPPLAGRRIAQLLGPSTGGIGTHVRALLDPLATAGARVTVCGPAATDALFGFSATAGFVPLGPALRRVPADLVHAHGLRAGLLAAAARRRPLVLTLHNPAPGHPRALRAAVRAADVVLAASPDLAAAARRLGGADVRDAPVAAPALPPPRRDAAAAVRAELGLADGRPLVLAVGRLHPQKGHDVLLDAAAGWAADARLPVPPLVAVAGDGPLAARLARQVAARRLPVRLLGRRDDVADLLAAADVVVLPSRWEARSLAAQEALRAGRPLVATRTGGLPALLGDGAVLVPPGDAAALRDAVAALLADPARQAALAAAGRRRAAGWPDAAGTARQVAAVYRELLGAPG
jgi:glycosyltransferase involved in cell wall biosynthesis